MNSKVAQSLANEKIGGNQTTPSYSTRPSFLVHTSQQMTRQFVQVVVFRNIRESQLHYLGLFTIQKKYVGMR